MRARQAIPRRGTGRRPLGGDRMTHFLVLCLALSCALWVLIDVQRLRAVVDVKENNLHDFLVLSQGVTSTKSKDPTRTAGRLGELLAGRSWEGTFAALEPEVVITESGPLLRLVKRGEGHRRGLGVHPGAIIRDGAVNPAKTDK